MKKVLDTRYLLEALVLMLPKRGKILIVRGKVWRKEEK